MTETPRVPSATPSGIWAAKRMGAVLLLVGLVSLGGTARATPTTGFNTPGNILIADQFNNRVIEVDAQHNGDHLMCRSMHHN